MIVVAGLTRRNRPESCHFHPSLRPLQAEMIDSLELRVCRSLAPAASRMNGVNRDRVFSARRCPSELPVAKSICFARQSQSQKSPLQPRIVSHHCPHTAPRGSPDGTAHPGEPSAQKEAMGLSKDRRDDVEVLWEGWQPLPFPKGDREGFVLPCLSPLCVWHLEFEVFLVIVSWLLVISWALF